jgi:hypothetical protein
MSATLFDAATGLVVFDEAPQLVDLAAQINAATRSAEASARSAMDSALEAGTLLTNAKKLVPHGEWESWLIKNCVVAPRTAQAYMRLAKTMPLLESKEAQRVADLPIREAIRAIATDPTPPIHYPDVRVPGETREHRLKAMSRTTTAFMKGSRVLREYAQTVQSLGRLNGKQVSELRATLTKTLEALDAMTTAEVNHG